MAAPNENHQRSRFVPPWAKKGYKPPQSIESKPLGELTNLELLYREMADRFPSIEDLDSGAQPSEAPAGGSFLDRERAALGDDADLFSSGNEQTATVEDGDNDLLGGDFSEVQQTSLDAEADELDGFESSFPAIDTRNEVRSPIPLTSRSNKYPERRPWWFHHQHLSPILHQLQPTHHRQYRLTRHRRVARKTHS